MSLSKAVADFLDRAADKLGCLAAWVRTFNDQTAAEPEDDLGEDEPFEGVLTREAVELRVVPPPRPKQAPPPEPLKGSVQARLAQRRPRW